jgi:tetratricopeptide (TPR) repeat protein
MKDAEYYYRQGLRDNLTDYSTAFENYSKAIAQNSSYVDAYLKRGTLSYKILKRYNEALVDFDKAIELKPDCAEAYLHRGIVKCHLLKFAEALPDLDRAVELDPNDERAFFNRGKNKYMLKYHEKEVRPDLEKAVLLGSVKAADMLKLFYGKDRESVKQAIKKGVKERRKELNR